MNILLLIVYCLTQGVAGVLFKYGSMSQARWLPSFIAGNVICAASIWFMMMLYRTMNANVAMGIGVGGAFLTIQFAIVVLFKSQLSAIQYAGLFAVTAGIMLLSLGGKTAL